MKGFAKELFKAEIGRTPWKETTYTTKSVHWGNLYELVKKQILPETELIFAEQLLNEYPFLTEPMAALICHLTLATRAGHLCICIKDNKIYPDVIGLWHTEGSVELSDEESKRITNLIIAGSLQLPGSLVTPISLESDTIPSTPLCSHNNNFYFQKQWICETQLINHLKRILKSKPKLEIDKELVKKYVDESVEKGALLPTQGEAVIKGCNSSFSIISGGPGTGKTYTASQFITAFWNGLEQNCRNSCEIAVAAPTGKAAAHLQSKLNKLAEELEGFKPIKAKTLHALLGVRGGHKKNNLSFHLTADLILVDESSMIDAQLMAQLFLSIKSGARVLLLGDPYQLPSVAAGAIFADLIQYRKETEDSLIVYAELKTCLRTDLKEIVDFAQALNSGDEHRMLSMLKSSSSGLYRLNLVSENSAVSTQTALLSQKKALISHVDEGVPFDLEKYEDSKDLINAFNAMRLLTPMRKGFFGVEEWNCILLNHFQQKAMGKEWFIAPIILTSTDYPLDLFNGECGVLVCKQNGRSLSIKEGDYALFPGRQGTEIRKIPAILLPRYEYAYCLSVHKSQGSEFDHVILLLPEGSELFGREILYTAATRARKRLEICGTDETLRKTLSRRNSRLSGLKDRLHLV